jgi:dihydrofolate synthase/folylpolyglutamate synthase
VITRIALDHTAILGDTIEEIAAQKCGIIKEGCPVASSSQEDEAMAVIVKTSDEKHAALFRGEDIDLREVYCGLGGTEFVYRGERMRLSLVGEHQVENLRCALAAIEAMNERHGLGITARQIGTGLAKVKHPARFEVLGENPVVVLDGAHNPNGLAAFADTVKTYAPEGERTLVIGMLADKDSAGLEFLRGLFTRAIVTNIDNPRALAAEELAGRLGGIVEQIEVIERPGDAFKKATEYRGDIYICGSLYLASQIRPYILESLSF